MTEKIEHIRKLIEKRKATHDLDTTYDIVKILSTMPVGTQISEIQGREKFIHRKIGDYDWLFINVTTNKHYSEVESSFIMGLWMYGQISLLNYHEKPVI